MNVIGHISRLTGRPDHLNLAKAQLPRLEARSKSGDFRNPHYRSQMTLRIFIAVMDKDSDAARRIDRSGEEMPTVQYFGPCNARVLGLQAHTAGRHTDSAKHYEDSLEFCRKAGYKPELAWTCSDYAELLLSTDAPGSREKATELQDEAIAITTKLGMKPLLERVLAQREILKA